MNIEYIILTVGNYTSTQLKTISDESVSPIEASRYNNDKTKCIIKVNTSKLPENCEALTRYSLSEIKLIMDETEWQTPAQAVSDSELEEIKKLDAEEGITS